MPVPKIILQVLPRSVRWRLRQPIQRVFEAFGSDYLSYRSMEALDRKLLRYLDYSNGYFIEAGAYDGMNLSNTYYFERFRGWRGILVEAIPEFAEQCRKNRPKAHLFECALVSEEFKQPTVSILRGGAMSRVTSSLTSAEEDATWRDQIRDFEKEVPTEITVPAERIDLFSLDVEGFEAEVLSGLDLTRYRPRYILVEVRNWAGVEAIFAQANYREIERLTEVDVLYADATLGELSGNGHLSGAN